MFESFPRRASRWVLRSRILQLPSRPLLMGIVNVTPDSFSDGGTYFSTAAAVDHALQLAAAGADMLDIGGESTRPYATPVEENEELRRVIDVVQAVAEQTELPVSIDTYKAKVAEEAIAAGAEILNDVSGLTADPASLKVAAETGVGVCAMHMQGTPQTMQDNPRYADVVSEVLEYLSDRATALVAAGVAADKICLDPGIGFGKTHQHNLQLMSCVGQLHQIGCPLLVGHSRKGFLGKVLGDKTADRAAATAGAAVALANQGVQILRVHDVRVVRDALVAYEAVGGLRDCDVPAALPNSGC